MRGQSATKIQKKQQVNWVQLLRHNNLWTIRRLTLIYKY